MEIIKIVRLTEQNKEVKIKKQTQIKSLLIITLVKDCPNSENIANKYKYILRTYCVLRTGKNNNNRFITFI